MSIPIPLSVAVLNLVSDGKKLSLYVELIAIVEFKREISHQCLLER